MSSPKTLKLMTLWPKGFGLVRLGVGRDSSKGKVACLGRSFVVLYGVVFSEVWICCFHL